jgi:Ca2+-binding RTX toxin-like protein
LDGEIGDDKLFGDLGNDLLYGGDGNDVVNGGIGTDFMEGGSGNDTYVVDNSGDVVVEGTNQGTDTVQSSVTHTLVANVENLTLTGTGAINGTGNSLNNVLTGNSGINVLNGGDGNDTLNGAGGNDTLRGGSGNDTLNGGSGADRMEGGSGNDTYIVDNAKDVVSEGSGAGTDTVKASVSHRLSTNVERLILTGTKAINGTGNGLNNRLTGNSANNVLNGGGGNDAISGGGGEDILIGGTGKDTMTGGTGADTFTYKTTSDSGTGSARRDVITDFNGSDGDRIDLSAIDAFSGSTGNQAFAYIGSSLFSGTRGEVRFASSILQANTGTDTVADMEIQLTGVTSFSETFLVL